MKEVQQGETQKGEKHETDIAIKRFNIFIFIEIINIIYTFNTLI